MSKLSKGKSLLAQNSKTIATEPTQTNQTENQQAEPIRCTVTLGKDLDITSRITNHITQIHDMLPKGAIAPTPATVLREFMERKDQEITELFDIYLTET